MKELTYDQDLKKMSGISADALLGRTTQARAWRYEMAQCVCFLKHWEINGRKCVWGGTQIGSDVIIFT